MASQDNSIKTGDTYNPWKVFVGLYIPNCIAETTELSQSAKLCFGRLCQFAGANGKCFPKQTTLAKSIGVKSIKQVQRCLMELEKHKLIVREKPKGIDKLKHKPDTYYFVWNNKLFTGENDVDSLEGDINVASENDSTIEDINVVSEGDIYVASAVDINVASIGRESILRESDLISSKDDNRNSKTNLHSNNNIDGKHSVASSLRDKAKGVKQEPKPKKVNKPHKILKANQPYWDILIEYGIKVPKQATGKIYKETDHHITALRTGTYFDNVPGCEHLVDRRIALEDFDRFCFNFSLAVTSPDHMPNKQSIKDSWKKWYLDRILYNNQSNNTKCKSLFATYLDNPPEQVKSNLKDPNPNITNHLIEEVMKRYGWDLSNGDRNTAIRCTKKLTRFFADNKDKMPLYGIHYSLVPQQVGILLEALEKNEYADRPMEPMYLYGDLTYSKFLPKHLKYVGSMND